MAQALATQGAFLPAPYMKLAKLMDNAEHFDYEIVREVSKPLPTLILGRTSLLTLRIVIVDR